MVSFGGATAAVDRKAPAVAGGVARGASKHGLRIRGAASRKPRLAETRRSRPRSAMFATFRGIRAAGERSGAAPRCLT